MLKSAQRVLQGHRRKSAVFIPRSSKGVQAQHRICEEEEHENRARDAERAFVPNATRTRIERPARPTQFTELPQDIMDLVFRKIYTPGTWLARRYAEVSPRSWRDTARRTLGQLRRAGLSVRGGSRLFGASAQGSTTAPWTSTDRARTPWIWSSEPDGVEVGALRRSHSMRDSGVPHPALVERRVRV